MVAYKLGLSWAVLDKICGEFQSKFFLSIVEVFSTCFSANTSISKGEFYKSIFKSDLLCFPPQLQSSFSHKHLSYSLLYLSYRDLCCERILGDQSVVITKVLILVLRRRTCGFTLFRVLVRAQCRGAASASLRVLFLREQERD